MNGFNYLRDIFKNLNLFFKFQAALFIVSIVTLSVMGFFGYNQGQKLLSERSFDLLEAITKNKKKGIEKYFLDLKNQVSTLAQNPITIQALNEFQTTFNQKSKVNLAEADSALSKFYDKDFAELLKFQAVQEFKTSFKPKEDNRLILQYKYISHNPNPDGYKFLLNKSDFRDEYDAVHEKYHPAFLNYVQKFEYDDLLILNREGDVIYSVNKEVDFATNFKNGVFHNSNAARLFRRLMQSRDEDPIKFEDFENYIPANYSPVSFIAIPIFDNANSKIKTKIGVLMLQLTAQKLTEILTNNQQWAEEGLGISGETALVGPDFKLRNNTRRFLEDPVAYVEALRGKVDDATREKIRRLKTTVLLREYKTQATMDALAGKTGDKTNTDFLGNAVLDVYVPIDVLGHRWAMLTEMDGSEMFASTITLGRQLLIIALILLIVVTLLGAWMAKSLADPMRKIQREISMLAQGTFPKPSAKIYKDELGKIDAALNTLIQNMRSVADFAENVGKSNFDYPFEARGENDVLSTSLIRMRDNLKKLSMEESDRSWINNGATQFGELLRNNDDSIEKLGQVIIAELVRYLKANQGAFFIYDEKEDVLKIVSAYAYEKYKYINKNIALGEGLVGQAFLEKEKIYLTEIPDDYSAIQSGLGFARPRCIMVMPLKVNEQVYGVIELASFNNLKPFEISLIESISEDIAITISSIKRNEETKRLLQESQKVTEQLRQQEEEMRQNFEELMTTQEEMSKRQEQIDVLLHDRINSEDLLKINALSNKSNFETDKAWLDKVVREAIIRQKELFDDASEKNKIKQEIIKAKVNKLENGSVKP